MIKTNTKPAPKPVAPATRYTIVSKRANPEGVLLCQFFGADDHQRLRDALPNWCIASTDQNVLEPDLDVVKATIQSLGGKDPERVGLIGFSAGCQAVRSLVKRAPDLFTHLGVFDGSHASWPYDPEHWQTQVWKERADAARAGMLDMIMTCTQNVYVETKPQPYTSTWRVVSAVVGLEPGKLLEPNQPVEDHGFYAVCHNSASISAGAHSAEQNVHAPALIRRWRTASTKPNAPELAPWHDPAKSFAERRLIWCQSEFDKGVCEEPLGSNAGPRVSTYLALPFVRAGKTLRLGPTHWCAAAQMMAENEAWIAGDPERLTYRAAGIELEQDAKRLGLFSATDAKPGDIWIGRRTGEEWYRHVGCVETVAGDGTFTTLSGNEADRWGRKTRSVKDADHIGFIRR